MLLLFESENHKTIANLIDDKLEPFSLLKNKLTKNYQFNFRKNIPHCPARSRGIQVVYQLQQEIP